MGKLVAIIYILSYKYSFFWWISWDFREYFWFMLKHYFHMMWWKRDHCVGVPFVSRREKAIPQTPLVPQTVGPPKPDEANEIKAAMMPTASLNHRSLPLLGQPLGGETRIGRGPTKKGLLGNTLMAWEYSPLRKLRGKGRRKFYDKGSLVRPWAHGKTVLINEISGRPSANNRLTDVSSIFKGEGSVLISKQRAPSARGLLQTVMKINIRALQYLCNPTLGHARYSDPSVPSITWTPRAYVLSPLSDNKSSTSWE